MNTLVSAIQPVAEGERQIIVLKFGGSIAVEPEDFLPIAKEVHELQRLTGARILIVESALQGRTSQLIKHAEEDVGKDPWTQVAHICRGEDEAVQLLLDALGKCGASAQMVTAPEIELLGSSRGNPFKGELVGVNSTRLLHCLKRADITVVAGFYVLDQVVHRKLLVDRGGSDWIVVALAAALGKPCFLCKQGGYVYDIDPKLVPGRSPRSISFLSWWQARKCVGSTAHKFLQERSLLWAEKHQVPLYFLPSPAARKEDRWRIGAAIGQKPAAEGFFVGMLNADPLSLLTVVQLGNRQMNGELDEFVFKVFAGAHISKQDNTTQILVPPAVASDIVEALVERLDLLEPTA